jgi:hypothetical protein
VGSGGIRIKCCLYLVAISKLYEPQRTPVDSDGIRLIMNTEDINRASWIPRRSLLKKYLRMTMRQGEDIKTQRTCLQNLSAGRSPTSFLHRYFSSEPLHYSFPNHLPHFLASILSIRKMLLKVSSPLAFVVLLSISSTSIVQALPAPVNEGGAYDYSSLTRRGEPCTNIGETKCKDSKNMLKCSGTLNPTWVGMGCPHGYVPYYCHLVSVLRHR